MILSNLPSGSEDRLVKAQVGVLGELAISLVDVDERCVKYESVPNLAARMTECLRFLLNGKVICESMEGAFKLRNKKIREIRQIITKDGDVINRGSIAVSSVDKEKEGKRQLGTSQNIALLQKRIEKESKAIEEKI